MHDAHFHMTDALFRSLKAHGIQGIANAESMKEYAMLKKMQQACSFFISLGVHPWHASMDAFYEMEALMRSDEVRLIGEIGLDSVWCDTPMDVQREVFEAQLRIASELHKPVILHTKGMEQEIAWRIRKYPNTYLVHWYSSLEHLEDYPALDCYFTIGPSVGLDAAVTNVAKMVPLDRMLIETDGIEAIRWAFEEYKVTCPEDDLHRSALLRSIGEIARFRGLAPEAVAEILEENYKAFAKRMTYDKIEKDQ